VGCRVRLVWWLVFCGCGIIRDVCGCGGKCGGGSIIDGLSSSLIDKRLPMKKVNFLLIVVVICTFVSFLDVGFGAST